MKIKFSTVLFFCLEGLMIAFCVAIIHSLFVPDLFSLCVRSSGDETCASFGVFSLRYYEMNILYRETTSLFMAIRSLVFICALMVFLSVFAAIIGFMCETGKMLVEGFIFWTMALLIVVNIVYNIQWCQSKLTGSFIIDPFPFHELRPISKNLTYPFLLGALYPMIVVFFFIGILISITRMNAN
ncbi:hypothetical protein RF11_13465 [Thelohanellus kitauei]|uniref:Uncharacterized protein n=1 Tax=Thelohanellus kitauei TaxID=669202 RepID=A0A0C2MRU4_THEKT|nr:hypothetical protein RF11_13465 [Thelohanellus kitauei]